MSDLEYLKAKANEFDGMTRHLAAEVLECPAFLTGSGSGTPGRHHYGDWGLLAHTAEVVRVSQAMLAALPGVGPDDARLLFLAALYHDFAKTYEYVKDEKGVWGKAPFAKTVGHVVGSAMMWDLAAREIDMSTGDRMAVTHLILAHHGCKEWGSPVEPANRLAWVLHLADMASARWADNGEGKKS